MATDHRPRAVPLFGLLLGTVLLLGAWPSAGEEKPVYYYNPAWSPDGSKILFESTREGRFALYTIGVDGGGLTRLSSGEGDDENPSWSPDGSKVVFTSDRDGHLQLYVMDADGSNRRRLTDNEAIEYAPHWSPRGDRIVFASRPEQPGVFHDLYLIRPDGSGRTRLTDQSTNDYDPRFSPDGKRIAFSRNRPPKKYYRDMTPEERAAMRASQEIFVIGADGTGARALTDDGSNDCCAFWSADGGTLYFKSERGGSAAIYAADPDGGQVRRVIDAAVVAEPCPSPDGRYFAYAKEVDGRHGVYLYDREKGEERLLIGG